MNSKIIRIATRKSPLALWQAKYIGELLIKNHPDKQFELVPMVTSGDKFLTDKLLVMGNKGLFVKELEEALLDNRADIAVHSTKDMPAQFPEGLHLVAICKRDNPLDALISSKFSSIKDLPQNAVVGTASLRRQFQLLALRPDIQIKTLRGNINTRIAKLEAGEYQAIILAAAGLERMGLNTAIKEILSDQIMLPACGQGALCVESRIDDVATNNLLACLNHPLTSLCVHTERSVNAQLGGNCHVPLAVYCTVLPTNELYLRAKIGSPDGLKIIFDEQRGTQSQAQELANLCTQALLSKGADELLGLPL